MKTRTCDIQDYWANVELGQLDQSNQRNVTWGRYRNHAWSILIISKRMRKPQMTIHTFIVYSRESRDSYDACFFGFWMFFILGEFRVFWDFLPRFFTQILKAEWNQFWKSFGMILISPTRSRIFRLKSDFLTFA